MYFLLVNNNKKYPNKADIKDPDKTPILTSPINSILLAKARFPTNKLIVKPMPVKMATPYKLNQLDLVIRA